MGKLAMENWIYLIINLRLKQCYELCYELWQSGNKTTEKLEDEKRKKCKSWTHSLADVQRIFGSQRVVEAQARKKEDYEHYTKSFLSMIPVE